MSNLICGDLQNTWKYLSNGEERMISTSYMEGGFYVARSNSWDGTAPWVSIVDCQNGWLKFRDDYGTERTFIDRDGTIYLSDSSGTQRNRFSGADGTVALYDSSGNQRQVLNGDGEQYFYNGSGTLRQKLDSNGKLWQYDANGKQRTYLEYGDIMLYTSAEKQTAKLSGSAFASGGSLELYDTNAVERARLLIDGLSFYNASGSMTAIYPATFTNHNNTTVGSNPTYVESQNVRWTKMGHVVTLSGWFQMTGTTPSVGTWLLADLPPSVQELDFTVYDQNSQTTRMVMLKNDGKLYAAQGMATSGLSLHYMNVAITYICRDATQ
jgi:hypothetical protein